MLHWPLLMLRVIAWIMLSTLMGGANAVAQMDLHAHLDLKPGVGLLMRGNFSVPPLSGDWDTKFATKASATSLTEFESPPLIVVSLYAHPYFSVTEVEGSVVQNILHFDPKDNVRRAIEQEYQHVLAFVNNHPRFGIAKSPIEAENLITDRRIPIVLSIEGAYGALETEADFKKWIDDRGVAIVTPFHLSEDQFGGTAMMSGVYGLLATPIEFFRALFRSGGSCISTYCKSTTGMKNDGRELVSQLMKRRVWIDLAHANDLTVGELLPILKQAGQPVLVTHTSPRDIYPAERGLSVELMNAVIANDGILGFIPTEDMIKNSWQGTDCFSSLFEFRQTIKEMIRRFGAERVTLASDINAPISGLSPLCRVDPAQIPSDIEQQGFYTYSQWTSLAQYVSPDPTWHEKSLKHFIRLWKKVRSPQP